MRKWDIRFLNLAEHISHWSKDPSTRVGAVVVDPVTNIVRGFGYNGFPRGVADYPDRYSDRETKYKFVVHAEQNSLINSNGSVRGCTIYIYPTLMNPPVCPECCKSVIQFGIRRVVCYDGDTQPRWQELSKFSKTMLLEAGIKIDLVKPVQASHST